MEKLTEHRITRSLVIAACLGLLGGCATTLEPPAPKAYEIRADANTIMNRDIAGKPLSVVVRLYQLKQEKDFNLLTFDLATSSRTDAELFGDSLIQRSELLMVPGTTHISTQTLLPETKYLGVVAFFRKPDAHYWRYLISADQVRAKGLSFHALDCYLRIRDTPSVQIPGQPVDAKPFCQDENFASPSTAPTAHSVGTTPPAETHDRSRNAPRNKRFTQIRPPEQSPPTITQAPVRARPVTPLPTPPVAVEAKPVITLPTVQINVTPTLGLPKWGIQ